MAAQVEVPEYEIHEEIQVDPAKTALIVVDMQKDFVKEGGALVVPGAEGTIPEIQGLSGRSGASTSTRAPGAGR